MTERTILIIKTSWSCVIAQPENPGTLFYETLFVFAPCLRSMFESDTEHQVIKFTDVITYMVTNLQNKTVSQNELAALAKRHVQYGAEPEHYALVGNAFLVTLKTLLGDSWDSETAAAWENLYEFWTSSMIKQAYGEEEK